MGLEVSSRVLACCVWDPEFNPEHMHKYRKWTKFYVHIYACIYYITICNKRTLEMRLMTNNRKVNKY